MSLVTDIRSYAGKATHVATNTAANTVHELRTTAEKAVNVDAITSAVEPYVAQLRQYSTTVTDRIEDVVAGARSDKRIDQLVTTAEALTGVVVTTVNERVVRPVVALTGRASAGKPATRKTAPTKPAAKRATKPATKPTTKPTARKTTAAGTSARKTTAAKTTGSQRSEG